eukprot:Awhi_evm2s260
MHMVTTFSITDSINENFSFCLDFSSVDVSDVNNCRALVVQTAKMTTNLQYKQKIAAQVHNESITQLYDNLTDYLNTGSQ